MVRGVPGSLCAFIVVTGGVLPHTQAKGEGERGALDGEGEGGRKITAREKGEERKSGGARWQSLARAVSFMSWDLEMSVGWPHEPSHRHCVALHQLSQQVDLKTLHSDKTTPHDCTPRIWTSQGIMMTHGPPSVPYLFWLAGDADLPPHQVHQRLADGEA